MSILKYLSVFILGALFTLAVGDVAFMASSNQLSREDEVASVVAAISSAFERWGKTDNSVTRLSVDGADSQEIADLLNRGFGGNIAAPYEECSSVEFCRAVEESGKVPQGVQCDRSGVLGVSVAPLVTGRLAIVYMGGTGGATQTLVLNIFGAWRVVGYRGTVY